MKKALRSLPDYPAPGLKLLFVGINPGLVSAAAGHYYANPRNNFWRLLHESKITPVRLRPDEDARMPEYGLGLTDISPSSKGMILIGRRKETDPATGELRRQMREDLQIEIRSYNYLLEAVGGRIGLGST